MTLRIVDPDTPYRTEVEAVVPLADGGVAAASFTVDIKCLPLDRYTRYAIQGDAETVRQVVVGWSGIEDAAGNELPFGTDHLAELSEMPYFFNAVLIAYSKRFSPVKNS